MLKPDAGRKGKEATQIPARGRRSYPSVAVRVELCPEAWSFLAGWLALRRTPASTRGRRRRSPSVPLALSELRCQYRSVPRRSPEPQRGAHLTGGVDGSTSIADISVAHLSGQPAPLSQPDRRGSHQGYFTMVQHTTRVRTLDRQTQRYGSLPHPSASHLRTSQDTNQAGWLSSLTAAHRHGDRHETEPGAAFFFFLFDRLKSWFRSRFARVRRRHRPTRRQRRI
jgi:hypothetical protein